MRGPIPFSTIVIVALLWLPMAFGARADASQADSTNATPEPSTTNALCPVMTDEPVDPNILVEYRGDRVYFCCNRCRTKFLQDPDAYAANLAGVMTSGRLGDDHSHPVEEPAGAAARATRLIGQLHPAVVHFPIGLLVSALFVQLLARRWNGLYFLESGRVLVLLGAPAAVLAAGLGWAAASTTSYPGSVATLDSHRILGLATAAVSPLTLWASESYWRAPSKRRYRTFLILLGGTALVVLSTGLFGGALIRGWEHYSW